MDINKSGIFYVGNSVTGKPNDIVGAGTGGMLVSEYTSDDNRVYLYIRNGGLQENFVYARKVNGGNDYGWSLIK